MSQVGNCNCPCPDPTVVAIPGGPGEPGTNGTNGQDAFSTVQAPFVVPAINGTVVVTLLSNAWIGSGQNIFIEGAGVFLVNSKTGATVVGLTYLNYNGNTNAGAAIGIGSEASPSGTQPALTIPLAIANGGTNAITKAAAQVSLGVGQDATQVQVNGLTQTITNAATLVAGATITVAATGLYLIYARLTVNLAGVTFSSGRNLTVRVQNTTDTATVSTLTSATQIQTTANFPALDYFVPLKTSALTAGKVLQLQVSLDTVNSAGTAQVSDAELLIIPLALS